MVKSLTAARRIPYSELEPGEFGPAVVFVSHAWSYNFLDELVEGIGSWIILQAQRVPVGGWFLWIDIFVVNQHFDVPKEIDSAAA